MFTTIGCCAFATLRNVCASSAPVTGALFIGGAISGGTTTQGITLTLSGGGGSQNNEVKGVISNGDAALGLSVSKTGATNWKLSGANTYTGGTTVQAGTLIGSTSANAFGTGTITIGDTSGAANATLSSATAQTYANAISVAAGQARSGY